MRISKIIKPLCFPAVVCILNVALSFLLEYAYGASETMWKQYYAEEDIDLVFVGASVCSASFAPDVFDERMGVHSFNLGTPAQHTEQSLRALETVLEEHDIEMVIYGMGYFALQQGENADAELTFVRALSRCQGGLKGLETSLHYLLSENVRDNEKSVKYFFPWIYNGVDGSPEAIVRNLADKLEADEVKFDETSTEHKNWRLEKGFRPFTGAVDYGSAAEENSARYYYPYFDEQATYYFEELLKLCTEKQVELIVINTPHPAYDVLSCRDTYGENYKQVEALCQKYGAEYYDFSLAKPEIFQPEKDEYYDFEHLNYKGAQAFSNAVCDLLERRERGETLENGFYSVEEFMRNGDYYEK